MRLNTQNWKTKKGEQNAVKYIGGTIFLNIITIILTIMLYEGTHGIRHLIYIILGIQIISSTIIKKSHDKHQTEEKEKQKKEKR